MSVGEGAHITIRGFDGEWVVEEVEAVDLGLTSMTLVFISNEEEVLMLVENGQKVEVRANNDETLCTLSADGISVV